MKAYSRDLRQRILAAVQAGVPRADVARRFQVGRATVQRYVYLYRRTGDLAPKPIPGRRARIGPAEYPALRAQLAAAPDATLAEHCQAWEQTHGVRLSLAAMQRTIARLNWTRKKKRCTPPNETR